MLHKDETARSSSFRVVRGQLRSPVSEGCGRYAPAWAPPPQPSFVACYAFFIPSGHPFLLRTPSFSFLLISCSLRTLIFVSKQRFFRARGFAKARIKMATREGDRPPSFSRNGDQATGAAEDGEDAWWGQTPYYSHGRTRQESVSLIWTCTQRDAKQTGKQKKADTSCSNDTVAARDALRALSNNGKY